MHRANLSLAVAVTWRKVNYMDQGDNSRTITATSETAERKARPERNL